MPFCPHCGSVVSEEDDFCKECGAPQRKGSKPAGGSDGTKRAVIILSAIAVAFLLVSCAIGVGVFYLLKDSDVTRTYEWEYEGEKFFYTLTIEESYKSQMKNSDIDRNGTVSSDRYTTDDGTVFGVCDYIVVDDKIKKVSEDLTKMYKDKYGSDPDNDQYVNFVTKFVQMGISYDYDEYNGGYEYWRFPLETLRDKTGDCEDKSILLAALIDAKGLNGCVILLPGHAMCAIYSSDLTGSYGAPKHSDLYGGVDYYPIETTATKDIGYYQASYSFSYFHLYKGHVTSYYVSS